MIGIVESRADEASEHVARRLRELGEFEERTDATRPDGDGGGTYHRSEAFELRSFDDLHLELEGVAAAYDDPDYVVFASRHSGDTGPLLSAHPTGNFGPAEYGGEPGELAAVPPNALAAAIERLGAHAPAGYDVTMECTHHGPSEVGAPGVFVEVGSGPQEWADPDGARAVARAILDLADVPAYADARPQPREIADAEDGVPRHLVGFGGGHYAPRFTRIARETDWAVGHVAADWALESMGDPTEERETIAAAFERSRARVAVIEGDRPALANVVADLGYRVVGETWVRETSGVPVRVVEAVEDRLGTVADGVRFGEPARAEPAPDPDEWATATLPPELLDRASGVDREGTLAAVDAVALAYETEEGGTASGARALLPGDALPGALIDGLATVLRARYDEVTVADGRIVATETAFDPDLATDAGVSEGPAFGRLAAGEPVEVDGTTVRPEDVRRSRREVFEFAEREE